MKKLTIFVFSSIVYLCLFSQIFAQVPVVTDPVNQTVTEGETATFSITVLSGTEPDGRVAGRKIVLRRE